MLKIGNISLSVPFFQASLSGYSDYPMRFLARQYGSPLTFTGVMLDKIALHPKAVKKLQFQPGDDEHPIGAQILGADPKTMAQAAKSFESIGFDIIDLNFACPAPKVLRRGRGGDLLNKPETAIEIFRRVRDAVKCPVMIKIRIGFGNDDRTQENFWQICEQLSGDGVDAITIHGRTVKTKYRGTANWDIFKEAKKKFPKTTIIGSGDLFDAETIVQRLASSKVDGVIIARGAIGNPWIFTNVRALLDGKPLPEKPTITEQGKVIRRHFEMILERRRMIKGIRYFRKFSVRYCRLHPQRRKVQAELMAAEDKNEVFDVIKHWYGIG
jgi:nifR3 family TIM-barrel protein